MDRKVYLNLNKIRTICSANKWWLIGTFLFVLILGLVYSFIKGPVYTSSSKLMINNNNIPSDFICINYPQQADKFWMEKITQMKYAEGSFLELVSSQMQSVYFLGSLKANTGIEPQAILRKINIDINKNERFLNLRVNEKSPEAAYDLNKQILETYNEYQKIYFEPLLNQLSEKIDADILILEKEYKELSKKAEEYIFASNIKLFNQLIKENAGTIYFSANNFLNPELQNKLDIAENDLNNLNKVKKYINEDRNIFLNRTVIVNEPNLPLNNNMFYIRNIVFSFILSIVVSLIVGFLIIYIKNPES